MGCYTIFIFYLIRERLTMGPNKELLTEQTPRSLRQQVDHSVSPVDSPAISSLLFSCSGIVEQRHRQLC